MTCVQQLNPGAGFVNEHRAFCAYCDEDATCHVNVGFACMNVCDAHEERLLKLHRQAAVEDGIALSLITEESK